MKIFLAMLLNRGKVLDMDKHITKIMDDPNYRARFEARQAEEWSRVANEKVTVQVVSDHKYAFGSELATLRLFRKFHDRDGAGCGFSKSEGMYFFSMPL